MAETFVLLVFCLLLLAAAAITAERHRAQDARRTLEAALQHQEQRAAELAEENAELSGTLASLPPDLIQSAKVKSDWRELKLARDVVRAATSVGISTKDAADLLPAMKVLQDHELLAGEPNQIAQRVEEIIKTALDPQLAKPHSWPPIINLSEAAGFSFAVGSAELSSPFSQSLQLKIAGQIGEYLQSYDVDTVEVIGHTDEQPLVGVSSNFDQMVRRVLSGDAPVTNIRPGDNAGLGLARAIAVADVLRASPRLKGATVLPLSAAQLIMPGDVLSDGRQTGDVKSRRRIEIRIRGRAGQVVGRDSPEAERPQIAPPRSSREIDLLPPELDLLPPP